MFGNKMLAMPKLASYTEILVTSQTHNLILY